MLSATLGEGQMLALILIDEEMEVTFLKSYANAC